MSKKEIAKKSIRFLKSKDEIRRKAKRGIAKATVLTSFCSLIGVICCFFNIRKIEDELDMLWGFDEENFGDKEEGV